MLHHTQKLNVDNIRATVCQHLNRVFVKTLGYGRSAYGKEYRIDRCKCVHCGSLFNRRV